MKYSYLLISAIVLLACSNNKYNIIEPCTKFNPAKYKYLSSSIVYTSQASSELLHKIEFNGLKYQLGLSPDSVITYVSTSDSSFSFYGLRMGQPYAKIPKEMVEQELNQPGFGYSVLMTNGWYALLADSIYFNTQQISPSTPIVCFYKRCNDR